MTRKKIEFCALLFILALIGTFIYSVYTVLDLIGLV